MQLLQLPAWQSSTSTFRNASIWLLCIPAWLWPWLLHACRACGDPTLAAASACPRAKPLHCLWLAPCPPGQLVPPPPVTSLLCFIPIALLTLPPPYLQVTETPAAPRDPGVPQTPWRSSCPGAAPQPVCPTCPLGMVGGFAGCCPEEPLWSLSTTLTPGSTGGGSDGVSLSAGCPAGSRWVNQGLGPFSSCFGGYQERPSCTRLLLQEVRSLQSATFLQKVRSGTRKAGRLLAIS